MTVQIRKIREDDAVEYLAMRKSLDKETKFMLLEAGERNFSIEKQQQSILQVINSDNKVILLAEVDNQIAGFISANGGDFIRNRHSAHITIGILSSFRGLGIGTLLFESILQWAHNIKIHRLELTVMEHNVRAIKLYTKMGFEIEGKKRHALLIDDNYIDEYYMAKLI